MHRLAIILTVFCSAIAVAQPYEPIVLWDRSGETDSSAYGHEILPLGDQNDDGFADWAVLAYGNIATWHGTRRPYLEFFHGGNPPSTEPYFVFQQDSPAFYQSWFAGMVGDVNGDGYRDWMTEYWPQGFPPYRISGLFYGGGEPTETPDLEWPTPVVAGFYWIDNFDFNGDDYDDLFHRNNETQAVKVYFGGSHLDTLPDWNLYQPPQGLNQTIPSAVGDFNGDGASDFMCFNMNGGNLAVFLGGAGPDTVPTYFWSDALYPYSGMDSLNGDRFDDWGSSYVYFGRPVLFPEPDVILNSASPSYSVDAGDFNGDGFHDKILFARSTLNNPFGALDLHLGGTWLHPDPVFMIEGNEPPYNLRGIYTAAGIGDINGDGLGELAVGVWHETFGPRRGRCVIFSGDTLRVAANPHVPALPQQISITVFPNPFNAATTVKIKLPWSNKLGELVVYDALGREVAKETLPPLVTDVTFRFNGANLSSGTYFLRVSSGALLKTQQLILIR